MRIKHLLAITALFLTGNAFAAIISVETQLIKPNEPAILKWTVDYSPIPTNSWKWTYEQAFYFDYLDENLNMVKRREWYGFGQILTTASVYHGQWDMTSFVEFWERDYPEIAVVKFTPNFSGWSARTTDNCTIGDWDCDVVGGGRFDIQPGYVFLRGDPSIVPEPSGLLALVGLGVLALRRRLKSQ